LRGRRAKLSIHRRIADDRGYLFGPKPISIDSGILRALFFDIDTPLKQLAAARENLVRHCTAAAA
jgi:hypothetical protein